MCSMGMVFKICKLSHIPARRAPHHMEQRSLLQSILYVVEGWLTELLGAIETSLHIVAVEGHHETLV